MFATAALDYANYGTSETGEEITSGESETTAKTAECSTGEATISPFFNGTVLTINSRFYK